LKSKLGGTLLPFNHCTIDMVEGSKGYTVTSARRTTQINLSGTESFLKAEQGVELLLSLIHDEEPLENIFDLTLEFLIQCEKKSDNSVLPFTINLLHYLGLMPEIKDIPKENLQSICDNIIEEHGSSALKAKEVAKRII
ncbi:hypothetical protein KKG16_00625, partial [Patescibacteria group bacterium]|nr:hypothetical protein [Patescibacteria group bacterium]